MKRLFVSVFLMLSGFMYADNIDSARKVLKTNIHDTERVNTLNALCYYQYLVDVNAAFQPGNDALTLAKKIGFKKGIAEAYLYLSYLCKAGGNIERSYAYNDSCMDISTANHLDVLTIKALNQKGNLYGDQGDISKSLGYYLEAAKICEKHDDKKTLLGTYANIGINYLAIKQFTKSEEYLRKAIAISEYTEDPRTRGTLFNNLGAMYLDLDELDSAKKNFLKGKEFYANANYQRGLAYSDYYLGFICSKTKKYDEALLHFEKALNINIESGNTSEIANLYNCIAEIYISLKRSDKALEYSKRSIEEAMKANSAYDIKEAYLVCKKAYEMQGDYKTALEFYSKYVNLKDSLFGTESSKQLAEMQTKYETDKKESENKILQEKNAGAAKTIQQQRYIEIAIGAFCILLVAFAINIFRANKQKHKINLQLERKNHLIEKQKEEVEKQKELIEEKQKEILDSIHYAKRIQRALLPTDKYFERNIKPFKKS
ncbi:MAG: tetratricopeptide repeat protein [Bacteroidia bacterium]